MRNCRWGDRYRPGRAGGIVGAMARPATLQGFLEEVTRWGATGWVRDPSHPDRRVTVEAVCDGQVLGTAVAAIHRADVTGAGAGDGNCGFRIDLSAHALAIAGRHVHVRDIASGHDLAASPRPAADPPSIARFLTRWQRVAPATLVRLRRMMDHRAQGGVATATWKDQVPTGGAT